MSAHLHAAEVATASWGLGQWIGTGLAIVSGAFVILVFAWDKVKHSRFFAWTWKRPRKRNGK